MIHKLGKSIQDLVTVNGSILQGLSLQCGRCRRSSIIEMPRGEFTTENDLRGKNFFCPYCGADGKPKLTGRITDTRPIWNDD